MEIITCYIHKKLSCLPFTIFRASAHWTLFTIELLGIMVLNSVNLAVISNYITQCEMIIFYVKGVTLRLEEKSMDLMAAMKVCEKTFIDNIVTVCDYRFDFDWI